MHRKFLFRRQEIFKGHEASRDHSVTASRLLLITLIYGCTEYSTCSKSSSFITVRCQLRKVLFLALSFCVFVCVGNISGTAERICTRFILQGRRVWFLALTSLKVKVKGQRSRSSGTKNGIFRSFRRPTCRFMFGKTSLASSFEARILDYFH